MVQKTVGIHKTANFEDNQSVKVIQWLKYLASENNITIQDARRGGEKIIYTGNKKHKLDGYYFDRKTKTAYVYAFFGRYFHGCPKFYHSEEICKRKGINL